MLRLISLSAMTAHRTRSLLKEKNMKRVDGLYMYAYLGVIQLEVESIWPIHQNHHRQIGRFCYLLHHFLID